MKIYRVMENFGDGLFFTWYFHNLENAENRLNENVTDIDGKRLELGFDNGTWSLWEIGFED